MRPEQNLDQHLFSEEEGNHFSPKCFMTKDRKLGIDVGNVESVSVLSLSEWYQARVDNNIYKQNVSRLSRFLSEHPRWRLEVWGKNPITIAINVINHLEFLENNKYMARDSDKLSETEVPFKVSKPQEYCDQCGNTGFSLFDGKKCVHTKYGINMDRGIKTTNNPDVLRHNIPKSKENNVFNNSQYLVVVNNDEDSKGEFNDIIVYSKNPIKEVHRITLRDIPPREPNVHINKGLDVNIQDKPISEQIKHHQRQITDAWHRILKLIRESEEK